MSACTCYEAGRDEGCPTHGMTAGDIRPAAKWLRELRWWLRCKLRRYPSEVYRTVSPHPAPPDAVERLRQRVLTGDWESPDA